MQQMDSRWISVSVFLSFCVSVSLPLDVYLCVFFFSLIYTYTHAHSSLEEEWRSGSVGFSRYALQLEDSVPTHRTHIKDGGNSEAHLESQYQETETSRSLGFNVSQLYLLGNSKLGRESVIRKARQIPPEEGLAMLTLPSHPS